MSATTTETPEQVGTRVGAAIAHDLAREDMPWGWTGIDPQDADQITAAGYAYGSPEYRRAEVAAEAEYRRLIGG